MSETSNPPTPLSTLAHEVEEFVASAGWEQVPQLFALVQTKELLIREPNLATELDVASEFTPVAQDPFSGTDLAEELAGIEWPDAVAGCALAQEIVILPPRVEDELAATGEDSHALHQVAATHPDRREARLVTAVLRDGSTACVLRLRGNNGDADEFVAQEGLAPNLTDALLRTLHP